MYASCFYIWFQLSTYYVLKTFVSLKLIRKLILVLLNIPSVELEWKHFSADNRRDEQESVWVGLRQSWGGISRREAERGGRVWGQSQEGPFRGKPENSFHQRFLFELKPSWLQSRHFTAWTALLVHFALVILEMGVSLTICLGWPLISILLISVSEVARITGVNHQHPAFFDFFSIAQCYLYFF
jgi:hypothetical protein